MTKYSNGRKSTERRAVLFDGLLALCKPTTKRVSVPTVGTGNHSAHHKEEKLKELFFIRKVDIIDREDTDGTCIFLYFV